VEALESLVPLSGGAGTIPGAVAGRPLSTEVRLPFATPISLNGTVRGAYFVSLGNPDTGSTYQIGAAGRISPLGQTGETARIRTTGFIASGMATGTMSIAAPRGTLTLRLTGPVQPGFAPLPGTLSYTITGGTRAYRNVTGAGSIDVTINSSVDSSNFGLITLSFHGRPVPVA
jgi:hypothetical protein